MSSELPAAESRTAGADLALIDSHAHLQWPELEADLHGVLERGREAGVRQTVVVGTDLDSSRRARELARAHPELHATAGVHPCSARLQGPGDLRALEELVRAGGFVAVGETGLDQHHRGLEDRAEQLDWFHFQLDLAARCALPIVIHCRKAFEDVTGVLAEHAPVRGVLHCFSEGPDEQEQLLALGLHISFAGPVTRRSAKRLRQAAVRTPLDRLLVETDSPFLKPSGSDRELNEPASVRLVLETLAELRGNAPAELAARTTRNAATLFALPTEP